MQVFNIHGDQDTASHLFIPFLQTSEQ